MYGFAFLFVRHVWLIIYSLTNLTLAYHTLIYHAMPFP